MKYSPPASNRQEVQQVQLVLKALLEPQETMVLVAQAEQLAQQEQLVHKVLQAMQVRMA